MIDLNSLQLYKKKISSYIDENLLTFPSQSKINSLFNEIHKYNVIITTGISQYSSSYLCKVNIIKNDVPLTLKSIANNNRFNADIILTDNQADYTINAKCSSTYNNDYYKISNIFTDTFPWLSGAGSGETPVDLNFELSELSEIYFYASWNMKGSYYPYRYANKCKIKVLCDDEEILNTNLTNLKLYDRIRIVFDDYNECHTDVLNVGSKENM